MTELTQEDYERAGFKSMTPAEIKELTGTHPSQMDWNELFIHEGFCQEECGCTPSEMYTEWLEKDEWVYQNNGEDCSREDLLKDGYPRPELNPACGFRLDGLEVHIDDVSKELDEENWYSNIGLLSRIGFGDIACAEGMKFEYEFIYPKVTASLVIRQVPDPNYTNQNLPNTPNNSSG